MTTIPHTTGNAAPDGARPRFFANARKALVERYTADGWVSEEKPIYFDARDVDDWRDRSAVAKALGLHNGSEGLWIGKRIVAFVES
jgi:hypothetical protein